MNFKTLVKKLVPEFILRIYHWGWSFFGAVRFGFPGKSMTIIGVTGTSGKSTTVDFITKILEEDGKSVASLSSIRFKIARKEWKNGLKMTMPGRLTIQNFLKEAKNAGCQFAVLEVTSEGIRQFRHKFIDFDTVVFTNLSPEHIESHGSFEKYRAEKLKLFWQNNKTHVINAEDENAKYFLKTPAKKTVTFGLESGDVTLKNYPVKMDLKGKFNEQNAIAALAVVLQYGVSFETAKRTLEKIKQVEGRMEIVSEKPMVVVDYAHTPEQLKQVYSSFGKKPLVCVLGSCGGGRDKWKRPVLGALANQYCREIIITNEDPYEEDPLEIMEQVASQIDEGREFHIVIDRKEAIKKALGLAQADDVVIITGKGSENVMCLANGKKIPWSDKEVVREILFPR